MVAPKDFFSGVAQDLMLLASNLKQTLEETNGIAKPEQPIDETTADQIQERQNLENDSST